MENGDRVLVRVTEAAGMLGVGRSTIYELLDAGRLPAVHIGRSVRIPVHAIRTFAERLEREQAGGGGR